MFLPFPLLVILVVELNWSTFEAIEQILLSLIHYNWKGKFTYETLNLQRDSCAAVDHLRWMLTIQTSD